MAPNAPDWLVRKVFALYKAAHMQSREQRLTLMSWILCRQVTSTDDCDHIDLQAIADTLGYWQRMGELESRARAITEPKT